MLRSSLKKFSKTLKEQKYFKSGMKPTQEDAEKLKSSIEQETQKMLEMAKAQEFSDSFSERELKQLEIKLEQLDKFHAGKKKPKTQNFQKLLKNQHKS
jgi:glutamyl-tRNA reductase